MKITILGVPLDLGQERRGVDMGPLALRAAGLNRELRALGHEVEDAGNVAVRLLEEMPPGDLKAKYLEEIAETSQEVAERVKETLDAGRFPLCLGGDHSMAVGTLAGVSAHFRGRGESVGLVWVDAHGDMNTPETTPSGSGRRSTLAASRSAWAATIRWRSARWRASPPTSTTAASRSGSSGSTRTAT